MTGVGAVSAVGWGRDAFFEGLREARVGIGPLQGVLRDEFPLGLSLGAQVLDYVPESHLDRKERELLDRFAQFTLLAAREAVEDAGVEWTDALRQRTAVATGCCVGGQTSEDESFHSIYARGRKRVHPLTIPRIMANAGASAVALDFGILGPAWTVSTACSSSNHALGQALGMVRSGAVDLALAGGGEAPISYGNLKAWEALRVVSNDQCRPFSLDRSGTVLGEGSGMLVLEPLDHALARGAKVYAELCGFGMSSDAHHITQGSVDGPVRAMRIAIEDAGLDLSEIGWINAHGTGTLTNDSTESEAIRQLFGAGAKDLWVSSTKSMHGHALGAAGALEAVATVLAIQSGTIPPTANFTERDPECDLDVVPNEARERRLEAALSNSFAFGGLNAVLAFRAVRP